MNMSIRFILFGYLLYLPCIIFAQVGINTTKPQASLDVNGSILLRGALVLGTDPGAAGQVLVSQGEKEQPKWGTYELETIETGDYVLTNIEMKEDRNGLTLDKTKDQTAPVKFDEFFSNKWTVIEGVSSTINIKQNTNRVIYTIQTVIQSPYSGSTGLPSNNYLNVLCGIFIGIEGEDPSTYKLTAVREGVVKGNHYPQLGFTIISSSSNVPAGKYKVLFAFQRRGGSDSLASLDLYIGQGFKTGSSYNVSNEFMNKTTARVDVFEPNDR